MGLCFEISLKRGDLNLNGNVASFPFNTSEKCIIIIINQWVRSIPAMLGRGPERPTKRAALAFLRGPKIVSPVFFFEGLQALAAPT